MFGHEAYSINIHEFYGKRKFISFRSLRDIILQGEFHSAQAVMPSYQENHTFCVCLLVFHPCKYWLQRRKIRMCLINNNHSHIMCSSMDMSFISSRVSFESLRTTSTTKAHNISQNFYNYILQLFGSCPPLRCMLFRTSKQAKSMKITFGKFPCENVPSSIERPPMEKFN